MIALAVASCGKPQPVRKAPAAQTAKTVAVPLPRPRVEPTARQVRRQAARYARVLRVSCEKVRWYHANVPERVILAIEDQDVLLRGLTPRQRAQQRREARACLR
jgi:hypothetical protein